MQQQQQQQQVVGVERNINVLIAVVAVAVDAIGFIVAWCMVQTGVASIPSINRLIFYCRLHILYNYFKQLIFKVLA